MDDIDDLTKSEDEMIDNIDELNDNENENNTENIDINISIPYSLLFNFRISFFYFVFNLICFFIFTGILYLMLPFEFLIVELILSFFYIISLIGLIFNGYNTIRYSIDLLYIEIPNEDKIREKVFKHRKNDNSK